MLRVEVDDFVSSTMANLRAAELLATRHRGSTVEECSVEYSTEYTCTEELCILFACDRRTREQSESGLGLCFFVSENVGLTVSLV